jgi:transposase-like protein
VGIKQQEFSEEQVIGKLREAEVLLRQGSTVGEVSRKLGITEQTYYRWRREYGGMRVERLVCVKKNVSISRMITSLIENLEKALLQHLARIT